MKIKNFLIGYYMTYNLIDQMLEGQAGRAPDALAILAPDRMPLTYSRLYQHIRDVGRQLHELGIGRQARVAVVLPEASEMAVAFLTVAAVATSAPLNPRYQVAEFHAALSALQAQALLVAAAENSPARQAAHALGVAVIEVEPLLDSPAGLFTLTRVSQPALPSHGAVQPHDVALLLPTSGTTAQPKLVPLTHQNLCASARHICRTLQLTPADRCLNVMPLFHIHGLVAATLASLMAGASLVCPAGFDAQRFFTCLAAYAPTWYTAVPTIHQAILAHASGHEDVIARSPLRFIRSSSAPLPSGVMQALEQTFGVPVIEAYGMTEAAHQMCSNPLPPGKRQAGSVGLPAGPEVAIMDDSGSLLPPGHTGEIVVRGENVMAGYANNPAAHETAFAQGWFRTGDLGHVDEHGYVFITGRIKEMINRGGEKVAPREVEEVLLEHPMVAQAVVFSMPHPSLGEDVAAALVLRQPGATTERDMRTFASSRLADFKVPSRVVFVDAIPTSPAGKLQRVGLHEVLAPLLTATFEAPRTPVETKLVELWTDILALDRVGIHDPFLQLGGDSLIETRLLVRVCQTFQIDVPLRALFAASTIAEMAEIITQQQAMQGQPAEAIARREATAPCPLSFAQQRLWFLAQLEPETPYYNEGRAVRLHGPLQVHALQQALTALVARHEVLRTTFVTNAGQPVQVSTAPQPVPLPVLDLRTWAAADRDAELQRQIVEIIRRPFDMTTDLMLRATLLRLGDTDHVLLLVLHHIASDGWSMHIVTRDLSAFYNACLHDAAAPLLPLPIQYADYALWQRHYLQGERLHTPLAYWTQQLAGAPAVLDLPTDRPRPAVQAYRGARQYFCFPALLSHDLKALSRQEGVTLFMLLLAAFQTLLHRYTGQVDIVVGAPTAGRTRQETRGVDWLFCQHPRITYRLRRQPEFSGSTPSGTRHRPGGVCASGSSL